MNSSKPKFVKALVLAVLVGFVITSVVFAHANLLRSDPADGAILLESPEEIRIWFDEPVSYRFSSAQLFDANSQPIAVTGIMGDSSDPTLLIISVPELSPGVYSMLWKALSDTDGHYSQGLLVFGVGEDADLGTASVAPVDAPPPSTPEVVLRWLNLSMLSGFVGAVVMVQFVMKPLKQNRRWIPRPYPVFSIVKRRILMVASWSVRGAILVGIGMLIWQTTNLKASLPDEVTFLSAVEQTLIQTRWGVVWMVRQIILIFAGISTNYIYKNSKENQSNQVGRWDRAVWFLMYLFSLALIVVQALSSHAAGLTTGNTILAIVSHGLHLFGAFLWIGGILSVVFGLLPLVRDHRVEIGYLVKAGLRPYSKIAALSAGLLMATGLYNTGRQVASVDALLTTLYGQALIVKIGLVLIVGYFSFFNTGILHTSLSVSFSNWMRKSTRWTPLEVKRFSPLVKIHLVLGLFVLLATGYITSSAAPRDSSFILDAENVPNALSQTVDDFVVTLNTKPNRPGQNVFTVFAASTRRPALVEIARVILRFDYLEEDIGRETVTLEEIEPGRFLMSGNYLRLPGNWKVEVVIRRQGMEDSVARFNWVVAPPGEPRPVVVSKAPLVTPLALGAAIVLLTIPLHVLFVFWMKRRNVARKPAHERRANTIKIEASR